MMAAEGRLPDSLVACIGGGSNAIGLFHPFLDDPSVEMFGVEAAGHGLEVPDGHAASLSGGRPGVLHGNRTYLLMNDDGQINEGHSISAGLDYPGIGPEHAWLKESGRVTYVSATDTEALAAFQLCSRAGGHHPGAGAGARARRGDAPRAGQAARSSDGGEPVAGAATRTSSPSPITSAACEHWPASALTGETGGPAPRPGQSVIGHRRKMRGGDLR